MTNKFKNIPTEEDTKILSRQEKTIGEYIVLHEIWVWDGIYAESIIFANEDIEGLSDQEIEKMVRSLPILDENSDLTLTRTESGFTFVNFNFKTD